MKMKEPKDPYKSVTGFNKLKEVMFSIAPLTESDWDDIEDKLSIKMYPKNSFYIQSGQIESKIGFVLTGSFRWYHIDEKGEFRNYHFFLDNDFIVEFYSFLTQADTNMYIEAMEDSEVIILPSRLEILQLYSSNRNWETFGRVMAESVYLQTASRVHDLLLKNAEERYLDLISRWPGIFQKVSLTNIASYLGVKVPSLSRIRKRITNR